MSHRIDEQQALKTWQRAVAWRRPPRGLIHHTDRGAPYCGNAYQDALEDAGAIASMSRTGDCWDNAMAESLIKTIKIELARSFPSQTLAEQQLFAYLEVSTTRAASTQASATGLRPRSTANRSRRPRSSQRRRLAPLSHQVAMLSLIAVHEIEVPPHHPAAQSPGGGVRYDDAWYSRAHNQLVSLNHQRAYQGLRKQPLLG